MAWTRKRKNGVLVCWREDGRERARLTRTPEEAEVLIAEVERIEQAQRLLAGAGGIPGWDTDQGPERAVEPEFSFAEYLRRLIEGDAELRQSVRDTYMNGWRNHFDETPFGKTDIRLIGPEDVEAFWADVTTNRRNVYQPLAKAFNAAVRAGVIPSSPLARAHVKRPSTRIRPEDRPLSAGELEQLADAAREPRARMAILLMGYCGLRAGEVGGLRLQDVTFGRRPKLAIRQAVVQTRHARYLAPPKTRAGKRTIATPPSVADELEAYGRDHPPADDGPLFHRDGDLWSHTSINHAVQAAAKRAGMPPVHAHQLRHTAVSLLIDDGADPKSSQAFVGHANIRETLQTYGHLFDHSGEALAASMERRCEQHRLGGAPKGTP
jgi:integrase